MSTIVDIPRFLLGAPASGAGKTTVTCALLAAYARRGLKLLACKCGPDYIDPAFHKSVIGVESRNIDLFFTGREGARSLLAKNSRGMDLAVLEGAMGYYDGIAVGSDDSAWDVARCTQTPAVLVVDGRGRARSLSAEILGFARLEGESRIAGAIFNRTSPALCDRLRPVVERDTGLRVFGCLPNLPGCSFESRHLGLVGAGEIADLHAKLATLARAAEDHIDLDALVDTARSAPALPASGPASPREGGQGPRPVLAVARDAAFGFYYEDTLDALRDAGFEIAFFSPLEDQALPRGAAGLYLGGGYPELHAKELSANRTMLESVRRAVASGMPTVAECGGFLYLHETLEDAEGRSWPLVGAIPARAWRTGRLGRFGYVELTARHDGLLAKQGETLPGHEFHYWESGSCGSGFHARKPRSERGWDCVHAGPTLYAGFPHLALHGQPGAVRRLFDACAAYARDGKDGPLP